MATIVRDRVVERPVVRDYGRSDSGPLGGLIALILVLLVLFLVFYYGLPAIRSMTAGPTINVPKSIDVNVNNGGK